MQRLSGFMKRHTLWIAFLAVLLPLLVLLGLQYVWLAKLERVSAIAHKAALSNYLDAVDSEVRYIYSSYAERALTLPAALFTEKALRKAPHYWKKKPVEGARKLFVVDYTEDVYGSFHVYNPEEEILEVLPASDESLAMIVAVVPWQLSSSTGVGLEGTPMIRVDERDPEYRFILNPITDEDSYVVGVVGMILDEQYFRKKLLPELMEEALPHFFPEYPRESLVVYVMDRDDNVILSSGEFEEISDASTKRLSFVFADWTIGIQNRGATAEQWARKSFGYNMTLSALIGVVLIGGITLALRAADRAMKLSEMKSDFVSNVSHELRTPLASIRVFAEFLKLGRAQSREKSREYGEYIEAESRRLSRLIDNILDFSRIESGQKTYNFVIGDVQKVVTSTLETFEVRMRQSGFTVAFEGPAGPLPPARIDPDAIGQALNNLLDNAVKYSGGSTQVAVRLARVGSYISISIRDYGIGIDRREQKKIFDRFHRVGTGLVHDVKGSGLGLSIVHHVVRAHGGDVNVESDLGSGSTFSIRLPVEEGERGWEARPEQAAAGEAPGLPSGAGE